jgi:hypothetical protein
MTFSTGRTASPLEEVSGIAASRLMPDRWWVHNDSGDRARVFQVDDALNITAEVQLNGVFALDFEDIAFDASGALWVADTGDNLKFRPSVQLYGFTEPTASGAVDVRKVEVTYPDKPHDVETLLIDPRTGDGFLVDKRIREGRVPVFLVPAAVLATGGAVTVTQVASLDVSDGGNIGPTGGDISIDGSKIVIKTLDVAYLWQRGRNQTIAEMFAEQPMAPCRVPNPGDTEAIGFDRDGRKLVSLAEGLDTRMRTFTTQP